MDLQTFITSHDKTHLIFDFDETLFLLQLPWEDCLSAIQKELYDLDRDLFDSYLALQTSWADLQNRYIQKYGNRAKELIQQNNILFETKKLQGFAVNHPLVNFVKNAHNKHVSLWSSNTTDVILPILKEHSLDKTFDHIVTRNDVDFLKPDIEGFNKIYDPKISKEKYVMIGDSSSDKNAAKNAEIDFFRISFF